MRDHDWTTRIEIGSEGNSQRRITNTRDAAYLLLDHWPIPKGQAYKNAVIDCARALRTGNVSQDILRLRLKDAAKEAGLHYSIVHEMAPDYFELEIAKVCMELFEQEVLPS